MQTYAQVCALIFENKHKFICNISVDLDCILIT